MRLVIQRVLRASVSANGALCGAIDRGLLVLVGVGLGDDASVAERLATKMAALRIFEDDSGKMNLSTAEARGAVLAVSQFTLYGDVRRGRRPSFAEAAGPAIARNLYEHFCEAIEGEGLRCERGQFGAHMVVELLNDGPLTLILDSDDLDRPRRA